jgi:hypothetical protein
MHNIGAYHFDALNIQHILAENPSLPEKETHS